MRNTIAFVAIIVAGLVPCGSMADVIKAEELAKTAVRVNLSPDQEEQMRADIAHDFLDPGAALYRDVKAAGATNGELFVCGELNGKNAFGGYVGFKPFVAVLEQGKPKWRALVGATDYAAFNIGKICGLFGLVEETQ